MPGRSDGKLVLWPHYFDQELSRAQGRRVRKDLATDKPKTGDVAEACKSLGLKAELLADAKHPRYWHERKGCVVVEKADDPKQTVLDQVARRL
jgi:signal recognition particle subunit SRP19